MYRVVKVSILIVMNFLVGCATFTSPSLPTEMASYPMGTVPAVSPTNSISKISPTLSPISTLPPAEAEAKIIELLTNNGGCLLPCFWNFVPGQANKQTVVSSLYTYGGARIIIPHDDLTMQTHITLEGNHDPNNEIVKWIRVDMTVYHELDGERRDVYDSPYYVQYFHYYTLSSILSYYGAPKEAYTFYENEVDTQKYYLMLDYTILGWVAMFTMPLYQRDGSFGGCPAQSFTTLWLWSPNDSETAKEYGFVNYEGPLKSIKESSSISLEDFYQTFKNPAGNICLETPVNIDK